MKSLYILEIQLLSRKEKKAKKVIFNRHRTLILGKNQTGKSSLIKSIYYTLGAEPLFHSNFKNTGIATKLKISVNHQIYQIVRDGNRFGVFNEVGTLLEKFDSITKGFGIFLSGLLDFKPIMQTNNQNFIIPPPAYLFLPYYIDQDESWTKSWSSFTRLQQIKDYRSQMIYYHSGIRPNEYYSTKKEVDESLRLIEEIEKERKVTNNILNELKDKIAQTTFNIDIDSFKEEIKDLLIECETLKKNEEKLKNKLIDFYNIKATIESQIIIVKNANLENNRDFLFASNQIAHFVDCPTCGAQYENSFTERFEIANDEQTGMDLLLELSKELQEVESRIVKENNELTSTSSEVIRIENILEQKQGEVKFKDVIDNYGKNQVFELFKDRKASLNQNLHKQVVSLERLKSLLKNLENKDRKEEIVSLFITTITKFLKELDIHSLKEDDYRTIIAKVESKETGSSRPRALIAYYYAFFNLIKKYSTTTFCPIIIDSPNQQDQDIEHIDKIMDFINHNQPDGSQMILGLAETYGVDFECDTIELTEKYSLLQKNDYEMVNSEMGIFLNNLWFK